jgi:glycosyltransferase involved in cell wall biosynthesis
MIEEPGITILMPIYNGIEFIEESVNSIKNQNYKNWELLIGINGYSENSEVYKIAEKYKNEKIKVIDFFNIKGKSTTLNEMLKYSQYNWIALLDVDDYWYPEKLKIQEQYLNNYDVIGTLCQYFGDSNSEPTLPKGNLCNFNFLRCNPIINSSSVIKKDLCFWDKQYDGVEDYDMWLRLWKNGKKFYNISDILVKHRIHQSSAFNSNNTNNFKVADLLLKYK